ncbi:sulfatase-like hydrolase/transferase [Flavobacterium sp. J49]|uniref:LTA synthase family protein n=1 Tax=Flavobacterium sp. J49 TaxID=2718534 RepID=UPI001594C7FB|nr:sulfatase-like hydrolase/transferase [Flavobacterium sp. J49]MBF6640952.1 sulfatase-like hydrolase/transferase [Flavobacterium sp. J49]NIC02199.1 sulfatase-like hydrolase/transferase [Flavobacterium sp. J49]
MKKFPRIAEYKVMTYRLLLAYVFYFIARILFYVYNQSLIEVNSIIDFLKLCYHGLAFDTTTILYTNALFIIVSVFPVIINTKKAYQKVLFYLYFTTNLLMYSANFVDFIYYRYTFSRSTRASLDSLENESNKMALLFNFMLNFWHVFLLFFALAYIWILLYKKSKVKHVTEKPTFKYFASSIAGFLLIITLCVGGIRGDFKKSTRPINMLDASRYVQNAGQADVVLNTPFAIIRTWNANTFKKVNFLPKATVDSLLVPIKQYKNNPKTKPNIVVFILESFAREYNGAFNKGTKIPNYEGYTPFVDSLAQHSLIFTNAYANGWKSIHGMSSVIAGIPSFKDAFTSSPYPKQKIESLVSTLENEGYNTSFFHGAPNGSMGFLGFSNILGYDHYYGKNEYNNDADFDGVWGIWDEPFFQFFNKTLTQKKEPFMATLFSVSSHQPYKVPEKFEGKFPKGKVNINQCIGYTDYALKRFFAEAKKQSWYNNTIFVLVADHGNTIAYDEYKKEFNKHTVPILFFTPSGKYVGVNNDWAQQIDIYPTLLDMIGYEKPFRSWGRSLISDKQVAPFVVKHSANVYQFMSGNYICTFDDKKAIGFYDKNDKGMKKNLIGQRNAEMDALELRCKAFIQDYMERVVDKRLTTVK